MKDPVFEERSLSVAGEKRTAKNRKYRDMQEVIDIVMHMPLSGAQVAELEKDMPLDSLRNKNLDVMTVCVMAQVNKAMSGDLQSFVALAKYGGYEPVKKEQMEFITPVINCMMPNDDDDKVLSDEEVLERAKQNVIDTEDEVIDAEVTYVNNVADDE